MQKALSHVLFFILAAGLAVCCAEKDAPVQENSTSLMPLSMGNEWIYENVASDSAGGIIERWYDTTRVIGDTIIAGETWYMVTGFIGSPIKVPLIYRQGGIRMMSSEFGEVMVFNDSLAVGNTYKRPPSFNMLVAARDASVKVPAGQFTCSKYSERFDNAPSAVEYYLAPGIGMVLWTTESILVSGAEGRVSKKLISTNVGAGKS